MSDKNLMENILLLEKGACDLFLHGTIESGTEDVHQAFQTALNASLNMQDGLYEEMTSMGWYPTQAVEQSKIDNVRERFSAQSAQ